MSSSTNETQTKEKPYSRLVLKHGPKQILVKRQMSYNSMLDAACRHFPSIPRNEVMLQTNQLAVCDGHYAEITAEVWDDILHLPHPVEVTRRVEMTLPVPLPLDNQLAPSKVNEQDSCSNDDEAWYVDPNPSGQAPECDDQVTIKLVFRSGGIQTTKISREMQVDKLVADVSQTLGHSPASGLSVKAIFGGVTMCANRTIGSYDIEDGDSINIRVNDWRTRDRFNIGQWKRSCLE